MKLRMPLRPTGPPGTGQDRSGSPVTITPMARPKTAESLGRAPNPRPPGRLREELLRFVDGLDDAVLLLDRDCRCIYRNEAADRLLGRLAASASGDAPVWDVYPSVLGGEAMRKEFEKILQEGPSTAVKASIDSADGRYRLRVRPSANGLQITLTPHAQALDSPDLQRLSAAFAHAADPIVILDPNGTVLAMNAAAEQEYRCEREAVIGQSVNLLIPEDLHDESDALLQRCRNGERLRNVHTRRKRMNGEVFPVLTTLSPVLDDSGSAIAITAMAKDITELRRYMDSQRLGHSQIAREARLISLGEMAAGLAHELNQPLAAISHYCDAALSVAQSQPLIDTELVDIIRDCYEQSQRAGDILRDMRQIIGRRRLPHIRESLNAIVSETVRLMMPEIRANRVNVELVLAEPTPIVLIDRVEIQQVIMNLMLNAIESIADADCETRNISVATAKVGKEARITVDDTGPGIDSEIATSLFELFVTTKPEGLGLGLWLCHSILSSHNGHIWFDAERRGGARFCITLPLKTK